LLPNCRANSPRAFANDDDTNANITFTTCAFKDNIYNTWGCLEDFENYWWCYFAGPAGAAGVTTASNVTFNLGSTTFKNNSWGALYAASPVTIIFEGRVMVADNTKKIGDGDAPSSSWSDEEAPHYGAGLYASNGAHLLFLGSTTFRCVQGYHEYPPL
jgi:hypothetical protein